MTYFPTELAGYQAGSAGGGDLRKARRGSIYLIVLGTSMLVAVLALSSLTVVRVERRGVDQAAESYHARLHAHTAIQMGLLRIKDNPNWRTSYTSGVWEADRPVGDGTYTLEGIDPSDNDLADSASDAVVLVGTGMEGPARQKLQVTLVHQRVPLAALGMALHAAGNITVSIGKRIGVTGAPLSTNSMVDNGGTIYGDVECTAMLKLGTVTGTTTLLAPAKPLPDASVFASYRSVATAIPYSGVIDRQVLSPASNPWGTGTNADGVYYINAGPNDLVIKASRIVGTLVVECNAGNLVIIEDAVFLQNYRPDYPALIVNGMVDLMYKSDSYGLSESAWSTNFNPGGTPYQGSSDSDTADSYPNEIQGLVHVRGRINLGQTARVRGAILCESTVECTDNNEIVYTPSLYRNPPLGYATDVMQIAPRSWRQVVE